MYRYYYSRLPKRQQLTCDVIVEKLMQFRENIDVYDPLVSPQNIIDIFSVIDKDYPELFYLDIKTKPIEISMIAMRKRIKVHYCYPISVIQQYRTKLQALQNSLKAAVRKYTNAEDRLKLVYRSILKNIQYNYSEISCMDYTVIGPLVKHRGICEGYAKMFKLFCDVAGIDCIVVSGTACSTTTGAIERHAWNIVALDGMLYGHMDSTWDSIAYHNHISEYSYFMVSDEKLERDHQWDRNHVPKCNGLYQEEKIPDCKNAAQAEDVLLDAIRKKEKKISFSTSISFQSVNEAADYVYQLLTKNRIYSVKQFYVTYRPTSNVMECTFDYHEN